MSLFAHWIRVALGSLDARVFLEALGIFEALEAPVGLLSLGVHVVLPAVDWLPLSLGALGLFHVLGRLLGVLVIGLGTPGPVGVSQSLSVLGVAGVSVCGRPQRLDSSAASSCAIGRAGGQWLLW